MQDENESLDLSDNEIRVVENFPLLKRLVCLFLCNNLVSFIRAGLGKSLPRLETLILTNNNITSLGVLGALGELPRLSCLSLVGNVVTKHPHYRMYVIFKCSHLDTLDFTSVRRKEKWKAQQLFQGEKGAALLREIEGSVTAPTTTADDVIGDGAKRGKKSREESDNNNNNNAELRERVAKAILHAKTYADIDRLQTALKEGLTERVIPLLQEIEATYDIEGESNTKRQKKQ